MDDPPDEQSKNADQNEKQQVFEEKLRLRR